MKLRTPSHLNQDYVPGAWRVWAGSTQTFCRQGWKLHIFVGDKSQAQPALNVVLPLLQGMDLHHKYWRDDSPVLADDDSNQGKWFVVYPSSIAEALLTASTIEQAMHRARLTPLNTALDGEIQVDLGYVYSRYGPYGDDAVVAPDGKLHAETRGTKAHPGWVANVWLHYKALTQPGSRVAVALPADWAKPFPAPPDAYTRRRWA